MWCHDASRRYRRRGEHSSSTAEVISVADTLSNGRYARWSLRKLNQPPITEPTVDLTFLQALSTFIRNPKKCYKENSFAAVFEAYDTCQIKALRWVPGKFFLEDTLMKDISTTADLMSNELAAGTLERLDNMTVNLSYTPPPLHPHSRAEDGCGALNCMWQREWCENMFDLPHFFI